MVDLGLRIVKLGKSSVLYEVGVFEQGHEAVRAVGGFIHVFVLNETRRPAKDGIDKKTRAELEKILTKQTAKL